MPKAFVMTPRLPWPLDDGGRIGLWQTVWGLAQEFDTTLFSLVPAGEEKKPLPEPLRTLSIEVIRIPHKAPPSPIAIWKGLVGRWPYTLERYRNRRLARALSAKAAQQRPDFCFMNHLHMATYLDSLGDVPLVLRSHNVEYLWLARYAADLPHGPRRKYAEIQAGRLRKAERELAERSSLVLAIQEQEAALLRGLAPAARVEVLPIGIDFSRFGPPRRETPPVVLIAGALGWPPNADGAIRFLEDGWPLVNQRFPQVTLRIAGKDPPARLRQAAEQMRVELTGYVDSMPAEMAKASLLLVPLWVGGGSRVKIIEAMAAQLPVVSTTIGAEGLELDPGSEFLLADDPRGLAEQVILLLESGEKQRALAARGRQIAEERWSIESVARLQNHLCREAAGKAC